MSQDTESDSTNSENDLPPASRLLAGSPTERFDGAHYTDALGRAITGPQISHIEPTFKSSLNPIKTSEEDSFCPPKANATLSQERQMSPVSTHSRRQSKSIHDGDSRQDRRPSGGSSSKLIERLQARITFLHLLHARAEALEPASSDCADSQYNSVNTKWQKASNDSTGEHGESAEHDRHADESSPLLSSAADHGTQSLFRASTNESSGSLGRITTIDSSHKIHDPVFESFWLDTVLTGSVRTTWQNEAKILARSAAPLVLTFMLQYSLTTATIFVVGHIGTIELGACSLASMTANITGLAVLQGLATSLDTLCAQAFGAGRRKLVGVQVLRMIYFLWIICIPIAILWVLADSILRLIVPEAEVAALAGRYLRVLVIGLPAVATSCSLRRLLQAQGLFSASLYALLLAAPLNAALAYTLVWRFQWGFIGAPVAVVCTQYFYPLCQILYIRFIAGRQCWPGFTRQSLHNWWPMIRLALPGFITVEAEVLAFEILTLAASRLGTDYLAANAILATACNITWQLPFPLSIAAATRIANLIGAGLPHAGRTTLRVAFVFAAVIGAFNVGVLAGGRHLIPRLFSGDTRVQELAAASLPICAVFQFADAIAGNANGALRGLGRQDIGGYIQLFAFYVIALPTSFVTAFVFDWRLHGLWFGIAVALAMYVVFRSGFSLP